MKLSTTMTTKIVTCQRRTSSTAVQVSVERMNKRKVSSPPPPPSLAAVPSTDRKQKRPRRYTDEERNGHDICEAQQTEDLGRPQLPLRAAAVAVSYANKDSCDRKSKHLKMSDEKRTKARLRKRTEENAFEGSQVPRCYEVGLQRQILCCSNNCAPQQQQQQKKEMQGAFKTKVAAFNGRQQQQQQQLRREGSQKSREDVGKIPSAMTKCKLFDADTRIRSVFSRDNESSNSDCISDEILDYCHEMEKKELLPKKFLCHQPADVNDYHRSVLVNWLIEVQVHLLLDETVLHLSVSLCDAFLAQQSIELEQLQLVGIACLFIAAKYEQRYVLQVEELIYLTDNSYTGRELLDMEKTVLKTLQFKISIQTSHAFIGIHWRLVKRLVCRATSSHSKQMETMTGLLLDLTLTEAFFSSIRPSSKSAAAVSLACHFVGAIPLDESVKLAEAIVVCSHSDATSAEVVGCMRHLTSAFVRAEQREPVKAKYSQDQYQRISLLPNLTPTSQAALVRLVHKYGCRSIT